MARRTDASSDLARLREGVEFLGLDADPHQIQQLTDFCQLVRKWNKTFNLVSRRDILRLVERHVLDSLAIAPLLTRDGAAASAPVLDLGSGAGFPGIPLAVIAPTFEFHLCDRIERRARFLKQVVRNLALENVEVLGVDAATLPRARQYGLVVARAVATVDVLWAMVADMLTDDGRLIVFRSTQPDATSEENAPVVLPDGLSARVHELEVSPQTVHTVLEVARR